MSRGAGEPPCWDAGWGRLLGMSEALFRVDAILFDIDGTLVDSTEAVNRSWLAFAESRGLDGDAILAVCHGRRSEDTLAEFLSPDEVPTSLQELDALEMSDLYDVTPLPASRSLLEALPPDRWAAVTSGARPLMEKRLSVSGLPVPAVLVTAEDVSDGKPDPQGYLKAASDLGFDITRCLVIEDAPAGIGAGLNAGASVLGVATSHPADELGDAHAVTLDLSYCDVVVEEDGLLVVVRGDS